MKIIGINKSQQSICGKTKVWVSLRISIVGFIQLIWIKIKLSAALSLWG